jgi:2-polyprenyl-6-methoxyphenol hydroxylase-like FAD-dependent oxidoreductase
MSVANSKSAIIVGGSVGGLFAGVLLQQAGWHVNLYERSTSGLQGKGAGLVPQSEVEQILAEIGRKDVVQTGVVARERIFLNRAGKVAGVARTPQAQISWDLLFAAFRNEIPDDKYHQGRVVVEVESSETDARVEFSDGLSERADLIVGADGIGSVVREAVAPGTEPRYAGYVAFRGLAPETSLPKESAALVSERFTFFDAPDSQFLGYLVAGADGSTDPGQRRYNWVWYRQLKGAQLGATLTSDAGARREYSVSSSGLSAITKEELRLAAESLLPRVLGAIVTKEKFPFLQAIFDYEAPTGVALMLDKPPWMC